MGNLSRGQRTPEDDILFRTPTKDRAIVPDGITPAVEGYFRIPAVWIGDVPDSDSTIYLNPRVHHRVVTERKLLCGINSRVLLDGTFLFDFSSWPEAPQIEIPGYRLPVDRKGIQRTDFAQMKAETYAVVRARVMNVHQACLATSERKLIRRSAQMGLPVTLSSTLKGLSFVDALQYRDTVDDSRALARSTVNNKDLVPRQSPFPRRVLEIEVVQHSLELLDRILKKKEPHLIRLIESAYLAACNCTQGRLGEAVTLAWGVCEQLLSLLWDQLIADQIGRSKMPSSRKNRLESSRDYSASVIIEILEIDGRLDFETYQLLETARKSRNDWAHKMKEPSSVEVSAAVRGMERLFELVKGVDILFQMTYQGGGVPQWNIWIWEALKDRLDR